jgi:hypothetical protein
VNGSARTLFVEPGHIRVTQWAQSGHSVLVVLVLAGEGLQGLVEPAEFVGMGHDGGPAVHGGAVVEVVDTARGRSPRPRWLFVVAHVGVA